MSEKKLLQVTESLALPGLGVLLLAEKTPPALASLSLHTALRITLRYPAAPPETTVATVEEIARTEEPPRRALLLTQPGAAPAPAGTEVWWAGEVASWEDLV